MMTLGALRATDETLEARLAAGAMADGVLHLLESTGRVQRRWSHKKGCYGAAILGGHTEADIMEWAREYLGFAGGGLDYFCLESAEYRRVLSGLVREDEALPFVRLPASLLMELRDGELSPRDFRAHVSLLSIVGAAEYRRVTWQTIATRSGGYLRDPSKGDRALSRWQVDAALEVLRGRGLWVVANYRRKGHRGGGERWFSNRLPVADLVKAVSATKARASARVEAAKVAERAAWDGLRPTPQPPRKSPATSPQGGPQLPPQPSPQDKE